MKIQQQSNFAAIKQVLAEASRKEVRIGFFETAVYPDGTPVAYIAAIQEFGYPAGNIPPRSFMRKTEKEKRVDWGNNMQGALANAIEKKSTTVLQNNLVQVGGNAAGDISRTLSRLYAPALEKSTLQARARKGIKSTKPLFETGKLQGSVDSDVVNK